MDTPEPKSLLKRSFVVSFSLHALLLISLWVFLRGDSVERAAGSEGSEYISVSLIQGPTDRFRSPLVAKASARQAQKDAGYFGGSTPKIPARLSAALLSKDPRKEKAASETLFSPASLAPSQPTDPSERKRSAGARFGEAGEGGSSDILRQIRIKIERNKYYPLTAKRSRIEGSPLIELKIKPDGSLEYVTLKTSSGSPLLDESALNTVKEAAPYPFYPEAIALNIHYSLNP